MLIRSKFPSKCGTCGGKIEQGENIYWAPGEGARHPTCKSAAQPDVTTNNAAEQHESILKKLNALDWIAVAIPLGLGPALVLESKDAFILFLGVPLLVSLFNRSSTPVGGLERVKWSYRKRTKFDVSFALIMMSAFVSMIPGAILWALMKSFHWV